MIEFVAKISPNKQNSFDDNWYVVKMDQQGFDVISLETYNLNLTGNNKKSEQNNLLKILDRLGIYDE